MADPLFMYRWYHGNINRPESEHILQGQEAGLFLVRGSTTCVGGYVLTVSENSKVSHYIIQKNEATGRYQIGEQTFDDLPSIVEFYKKHFLDTTTLVRAAERIDPPTTPAVAEGISNIAMQVLAKYNFPGNDAEDLPFKKGDLLTIIREEEAQWWMARDRNGREGMIPSNYVEQVHGTVSTPQPSQQRIKRDSAKDGGYRQPDLSENLPQTNLKVPCIAEALQDRVPTIYDPFELKFKKGEHILVINKRDDGIWEGQLADGKRGMFPFTYVRLKTNDPLEIQNFTSSNG